VCYINIYTGHVSNYKYMHYYIMFVCDMKNQDPLEMDIDEEVVTTDPVNSTELTQL